MPRALEKAWKDRWLVQAERLCSDIPGLFRFSETDGGCRIDLLTHAPTTTCYPLSPKVVIPPFESAQKKAFGTISASVKSELSRLGFKWYAPVWSAHTFYQRCVWKQHDLSVSTEFKRLLAERPQALENVSALAELSFSFESLVEALGLSLELIRQMSPDEFLSLLEDEDFTFPPSHRVLLDTVKLHWNVTVKILSAGAVWPRKDGTQNTHVLERHDISMHEIAVASANPVATAMVERREKNQSITGSPRYSILGIVPLGQGPKDYPRLVEVVIEIEQGQRHCVTAFAPMEQKTPAHRLRWWVQNSQLAGMSVLKSFGIFAELEQKVGKKALMRSEQSVGRE